MRPGVSFICTVYNKEAYLPGVLAALRDQAEGRPRQFIFVDDGSRDASMHIVREQTAGWDNCVYIEKPNGGPSSATNAGLAAAELDYIKLLGSDDLLVPGATEFLASTMEATGVDALFARMPTYRGAPPDLSAVPPSWRGLRPRITEQPLCETLLRGWAGTTCTLYRRAAVQAAGGCDPRVFVEDHSLALRVARIGRFAHIDADVAFGPESDGDRIMVSRQHQVLHDVGLAHYWLLRDFPELVPRFGQLAFRRAAGRAYKWARRRVGSGLHLRWMGLEMASLLRLGDPVAGVRASLDVYSLGPAAAARPIIRMPA